MKESACQCTDVARTNRNTSQKRYLLTQSVFDIELFETNLIDVVPIVRFIDVATVKSNVSLIFIEKTRTNTHRQFIDKRIEQDNYCMAGLGNFASNCTPDPEYPKYEVSICPMKFVRLYSNVVRTCATALHRNDIVIGKLDTSDRI
jgi:hypothetical protein